MPSLCWDARPEERINYTLSVLVLLKKAKAFYLIEISKPSNSTEQTKNMPIQRLSIARVNAQRFIHCHEKEKTGGAERDRTADLVIANDALSQLSYSPAPRRR